jgi:hypothetical protein
VLQQRVQFALQSNLAFLEERDIDRNAFEIGQDVGREHHRGVAFDHAVDQLAQEIAPADRVERRHRLVEDQQLRLVRQRADDRQALLLAARQLADRALAHRLLEAPAQQQRIGLGAVPAGIQAP